MVVLPLPMSAGICERYVSRGIAAQVTNATLALYFTPCGARGERSRLHFRKPSAAGDVMMREPEFVALVDEVIVPVLEPYGFQRVTKPDGWIAPEVLLESSNRWFGASWDWRDRFLDAGLGRLFLFRDVLPRVIVRGPLSVARTNDGEADADFVRKVLGRMANRLPEVLGRFDELYQGSITEYESTASPKKAVRKSGREYLKFLGPEITLEKWRQLAGRGTG